MARMHSRKRGKSGSTKPGVRMEHKWLIYDRDEVLKIMDKLSKEGKSNSEIGMILRDQYGIPDVRELNIKISDVLKKEIPEDLFDLLKRAVNLHKHMESNKKDSSSKHGLELIESKIRRLVKYYVRTGKLEKTWKYNIERAKLLVK